MLRMVNADDPALPASAADNAAVAVVPASLEAFFAMIGPRAFRFAELSLRHREDALDAVQDAMERMLGYRARPAAEWKPLFWSVLRSRIVDQQRRGLVRLRFLRPADDEAPDWADDPQGPNGDPAEQHARRLAWERLVIALRALPRRQREAFTLRVLEELDGASTATAMGISEGSVKTHLARAREALQKALGGWR
jgi:RNA polymerase sigma-70 factor (ECF subfamily)